MKIKNARTSSLLKTKGSGVYEICEALGKAYTFKLGSAYNYIPKGKKIPTEYRVYARVEDAKKPTRPSKKTRIIAGKVWPVMIPGRKVTTEELNRRMKSITDIPHLQFIRVSYDTSSVKTKFSNDFKFRFKLLHK